MAIRPMTVGDLRKWLESRDDSVRLISRYEGEIVPLECSDTQLYQDLEEKDWIIADEESDLEDFKENGTVFGNPVKAVVIDCLWHHDWW